MELSDRFCPNCSQANSVKHLTMRDFLDELFEDMVRFDTRLVRTLTTMLRRPGRVSKDFIAGKRKTYANPFRFLLTLAFIYFLLLSVTGDFDRYDRYGQSSSGRLDMIPELNLDFDSEDPSPKEVIASLDSTQIIKLDSLGIIGLDTLNLEGLDSLDLKDLDKLNIKKQVKQRKELNDSLIMANPRVFLDSIKGDGWLERTMEKANFFLTLIDKDSVIPMRRRWRSTGCPTGERMRSPLGLQTVWTI